MSQELLDWITLCSTWLSDPTDAVQLEQWIANAETLLETIVESEEDLELADHILENMAEQFMAQIAYRKEHTDESGIHLDILDELIQRKQTAQRTAEWYAQMTTVISASEVAKLFGSDRERGKMVMAKTQPYQPRYQPLAVPSSRMTAFDWGIRLEPVVKQIYEHKYDAVVKELGRMLHPTDPRCSASPDGLVYEARDPGRRGHLIEIKCPVTRVMDGIVPKDYYAQMQMQLQVTGLSVCEYVEVSFASPYQSLPMKEGPSEYDGFIAVVQYQEQQGDQPYYYVYSPIHAPADWRPDVGEDIVVEIAPWRLMEWSEQEVQRNEEWWRSLLPTMESFWEDVERAKKGEFIVPESSRPPRKRPIEACQIQFSVQKLDENGKLI